MTARKTIKTITMTLAAIGAAAGATLAPAAFAAPADDISVTIDTRYLETDGGIEKIYASLENKAESACATDWFRSLSEQKLERDCMSDLLDDFIESADHEKLTTFHTNVTS